MGRLHGGCLWIWAMAFAGSRVNLLVCCADFGAFQTVYASLFLAGRKDLPIIGKRELHDIENTRTGLTCDLWAWLHEIQREKKKSISLLCMSIHVTFVRHSNRSSTCHRSSICKCIIMHAIFIYHPLDSSHVNPLTNPKP